MRPDSAGAPPPKPQDPKATTTNKTRSAPPVLQHPSLAFRPAVVRAILMGLLFLGWLGYLAYLVWEASSWSGTQPIVLSHPQCLLADLIVIGRLDEPGQTITVEEVLVPDAEPVQRLRGQKIKVFNIEDARCAIAGRRPGELALKPPEPDRYVFPLRSYGVSTPQLLYATRFFGMLALPHSLRSFLPTVFPWLERPEIVYEVMPVPPSPGYPHRARVGTPRIYPVTPKIRAQVQALSR